VKRWFDAIRMRPATQRAYELAKRINTAAVVTDASRSVLFGQGRRGK
jgi:GST-like protein